MGKHKSLRSKAVHFVADLTTGLLNPISDKPSPPPEDENESKRNQLESITEEQSKDLADEPDTSSFTAFIYSLLTTSDPQDKSDQDEQDDSKAETSDTSSVNAGTVKETGGKKSFLSKYKQSVRAFYQAAKLSGFRNQERKGSSDVKHDEEAEFDGLEMKHMQNVEGETTVHESIPEASEPSLLLSEQTRRFLYASLPALVQGRRWLLLYSTWRHGISLSTLYRKSLLWPGLSLLVVGDRKGTVFGGLVEAPLIPTDKKYQGGNNTFVFTNKSGQPVIFGPTGLNRYFTLCSTDFLALGGGGHFALYLDNDLLNGSSAYSETYGNPCLSSSQDFEVKEVELWGFVYGSKYDEIHSLSKTVEAGISSW
ncbi:PREDICTED: oxidation resistance protein 1-like [Tarenaya hassleriana]|uniref:oxidation resistance protein 1-like n=1 Tax=Tarenaya hassleriana TaxID=28532 RepID=UPI00053CA22C|nr:PREDICTED: oxidation resistance protein 1-like [Tarenaya hassleriana]